MTTDDLIAHACPIIRDIGWAHFFAPEAETAATHLGIDLFTLYALGRGGVLGDVEPVVVASAFGYFNPEVVAALWNAGKESVAPREAARIYLDCAADVGRRTLSHIEGLDEMVAAADAVKVDLCTPQHTQHKQHTSHADGCEDAGQDDRDAHCHTS